MGIYLLPVYAHPQTTSTQKDLYNLISIKGNSLLVAFNATFYISKSKANLKVVNF